MERRTFILTLCHDVLFEVLQRGKRRELAMLEAVGRRFYRVIDVNFIGPPYLLLDLEFRTTGIYVHGDNPAQLLLPHHLPVLTSFVQFRDVKVDTCAFWNAAKSIGDTVSYFGHSLGAVKDSKLLVTVTVDQEDPSCFQNQAEMLNYFSNELLPIFNSYNCCAIKARIKSDKESSTHFVALFLQLPAILSKTKILVQLKVSPVQINQIFDHEAAQVAQFHQAHLWSWAPFLMPAEIIAEWLNHRGETGNERFLHISKFPAGIENPQDIFSYLKEQFETATNETRSFTLELFSCEHGLFSDAEAFQNQQTNEEFSIHQDGGLISIKRAIKERKIIQIV